MDKNTFENIIKTSYNFEDKKTCDICGELINDFNDNNIYENMYCENCFNEAQESRLGGE